MRRSASPIGVTYMDSKMKLIDRMQLHETTTNCPPNLDKWNETLRFPHYNDPEVNREVFGEVASFIKTHCAPWLAASGGHVVYRGITPNGATFVCRAPRETRNPRDSSLADHRFMNEMIKSQGLTANRSNSLFVTSSRAQAREYGTTYAVFPIGEFEFTWSPIAEDAIEIVDTLTGNQLFRFISQKYAHMSKHLSYRAEFMNDPYVKSLVSVMISDDHWHKYSNPDMHQASDAPRDVRINHAVDDLIHRLWYSHVKREYGTYAPKELSTTINNLSISLDVDGDRLVGIVTAIVAKHQDQVLASAWRGNDDSIPMAIKDQHEIMLKATNVLMIRADVYELLESL